MAVISYTEAARAYEITVTASATQATPPAEDLPACFRVEASSS